MDANYVGEAITIPVTITNTLTGALLTPSSITLSIKDPAGVTTTHSPTLISVGKYEYIFVPALAGTHYYKWSCSATNPGVFNGFLNVIAGDI